MRRFSSEGSLLDLDFLPWKRVSLMEPGCGEDGELSSCMPNMEVEVEVPGGQVKVTDSGQEAVVPPRQGRGQLTKECSISVENLSSLETLDRGGSYLGVATISEECRAYSDSQLTPGAGTPEPTASGEPSPSTPVPPSVSSFSSRSAHRQHAKAKLAAAKVHLKSLFGQNHHSSQSSLVSSEQRDNESRTRERRSRLPFLRQWSQVGHGNTNLSHEELEQWAESLHTLLASRTGVSVFGAFLRSEFSEENLQFYLACEQYRHSSNNFSLQRRAREICSMYIQPGATREVNLDGKTRDLTMQLLQAPSRNSLLHAQRRIFSLLDTDCYPRFLQSNIYQSLLRDAC